MSNKTFLGKVGTTPKGEWNSSTTYERLDWVTYQGSSYIALAQNTNSTPSESNPNWMVAAKHGEFTEEQLEEFKAAVVADSKEEMDEYTDTKKGVLDSYTTTKEGELDTYTNTKKGELDTHTTQKISDFDSNATAKTGTFNQNASDKTDAFNSNATSKTGDFNDNATAKTTTFDNNASSKTADFNTNASSKTTTFNDNASSKTTDFNTNAQQKTAEFDEHTEEMQAEITELQQDNTNLLNALPEVTGEGSNIILEGTSKNKYKVPPLPEGNSWQGLPDGYTALEYIESTGTQYIDTGVTADSTVEFDVDFETFDQFSGGTGYGCVFGSRESSVNKELQITTFNDVGIVGGTFRYGDSGTYEAYLSRATKINIKLKNKKYYVDGEEKYTVNKTFSNNYNIYIFALNNGGTVAQNGKVRIYTFRLYKNGELLRDYVPCKNSNNTIGLYDLVSEKFYANAGTGTFIAGNEANIDINPEHEISIHNVSGEIKDVIGNKNLLNLNYTKENPLRVTSSYTLIDLDTQADYVEKIIKSGDKVKLSCKAKTDNGTLTNNQLYLGNGTTTVYLPVKSVTISTTETTISNYGTIANDIENGKLKIVMYSNNNITYSAYDFMLEKVENDVEVNYVPHEQQTLPFTLSQGQKMYLGDYLADDGIHHVRKEIVFDGTENWVKFGNYIYLYIEDCALSSTDRTKIPDILCNNFTPATDRQMSLTENNNYISDNAIGSTNQQKGVSFRNNANFSDAEEIKAWLAEHQTKLEYPLATEVIDPYTPTQQAQYNAIKKATSYKDTTIITLSSDDADPLTNVVAVADMSNFNPNEIDEIKTAIVALGGVI